MAEANWQSITLRTTEDWVPWYAVLKQQATMWNVWQYIDPQASFLLLAQPPVPPTCPTYTDIKPDARHIMQLESHELTAYNMLTREYDR